MEIELRRLQAVINRLFEHAIQTRGVEKVALDAEAYWSIDSDQVYDLAKEPAQLDVGSLSDDWEFASALLDPHCQPLANQFTEVAPLLRRLGEVLGERLAPEGG